MTKCVFCDIVAGTAPANIIVQGVKHMAFTPLNPVVEGHTLIIPRVHVAHAAENPKVTGEVMEAASRFAAQFDSFNIITSAGRAATQSVDHLHIHVVPRTADDRLMTPWGTIYGDEPSAPHWCRIAQGLQDRLNELKP